MKVSAQFAEEHFADILHAASNGEEVEIALAAGKPTLRLVISTVLDEGKPKGKRVLGAGRGELRVPSEAEWSAMDRELEEQMNRGPQIPLAQRRPRAEMINSAKGKIWLADDWDSDETNEEIARLFNDGPIFPPEHQMMKSQLDMR